MTSADGTLYIKATLGSRIVDPDFDRRMQAEPGLVPVHTVTAEPAELQAAHFVRTAALRPGAPWALATSNPYGLEAPAEIVAAITKALKLLTGREPEVLECH